MKVETKPVFTPVVLTIESLQELKLIAALLGAVSQEVRNHATQQAGWFFDSKFGELNNILLHLKETYGKLDIQPLKNSL